jgi:hypothetical protein
MKRLFTFGMLFFIAFQSQAQVTSFKIESKISRPDFRVRIGEYITYSDLSIQIGPDVTDEDFTVGITMDSRNADFIITKSKLADYRVKAGPRVSYADLRIKAGEYVAFPDFKIRIKEAGTVDFTVYTEKNIIDTRDLVIALLPGIDEYSDFLDEEIYYFWR